LQKRRVTIAEEINIFLDNLLNHEVVDGDEAKEVEKTWIDVIKNGEDNFTEFKSTLRFCLRQEKPMEYVEHSIVKTINAFLNSEGGTLFVGVEDDGNILGLENDYASFSKNGKDGFLLHFDNLIIKSLGKEQQADIDVQIKSIEGKDVAIVVVNGSNKPVFLTLKDKKEFYVRSAASSQPFDMSESFEYINKHWSN
jgi:predicted HTH transcriptional regulator